MRDSLLICTSEPGAVSEVEIDEVGPTDEQLQQLQDAQSNTKKQEQPLARSLESTDSEKWEMVARKERRQVGRAHSAFSADGRRKIDQPSLSRESSLVKDGGETSAGHYNSLDDFNLPLSKIARPSPPSLPNSITFISGNPLVELTEGIIHLFKDRSLIVLSY